MDDEVPVNEGEQAVIREHLRRERVAEVARMVAERSAELNHRLS